VKRWGIAAKISLAVTLAAVLGVGLAGGFAWRETDNRFLAHDLANADGQLGNDVKIARALFDTQVPGPWHIVPARPTDAPTDFFNGNGKKDEYKASEKLTGYLYKGTTRIMNDRDIENTLLSIDSLTGVEFTISQRIPPPADASADPTVGNATMGRALRLATTVSRLDANGVRQVQLMTVMPTRSTQTGKLVGAGAAFASGSTFTGRAMVAGEDRWTRYEPIVDPDGQVIGIFYSGLPLAPYVAQAHHASAAVALVTDSVGLIVVLMICVGVFLLVRYLLGPLQSIRSAAIALAGGQLDSRVPVLDDSEIGHVGKAFNDMAAQLEQLNERIVISTEQLTASSKQVDAAASAASVATQQVASSIGEVSHGAAESAARVEEATKQAHQALVHVRSIQDEVGRALLEAGATDAMASDGHRLIAHSLNVTSGVRDTVGRAKGVMVDLEAQAGQIQSIVAMIKRIASQTNLLALNAAIEAARAGDAGRGFAVVANEIRSLADEVRKSSDNIGEIVGETKRRTGSAVALMSDVDAETQAGADAVRESDEAFRNISTAVTHLSTQITAIKTAAEAVSAAVAHLDTAIAGVAAIAQESAATSEEVSALAEEQTATLAEITREIHEVSNMAEALRQVVGATTGGNWATTTAIRAAAPRPKTAMAAD
jgi:methyl-accepting chemotaxis protein